VLSDRIVHVKASAVCLWVATQEGLEGQFFVVAATAGDSKQICKSVKSSQLTHLNVPQVLKNGFKVAVGCGHLILCAFRVMNEDD
jgi:hypothetical protein